MEDLSPEPLRQRMEASSDEALDTETNPLQTPDMNIGAEGFGTRRALTP